MGPLFMWSREYAFVYCCVGTLATLSSSVVANDGKGKARYHSCRVIMLACFMWLAAIVSLPLLHPKLPWFQESHQYISLRRNTCFYKLLRLSVMLHNTHTFTFERTSESSSGDRTPPGKIARQNCQSVSTSLRLSAQQLNCNLFPTTYKEGWGFGCFWLPLYGIW